MEETEHSNRFAKDNQSTDKVLAIIELLSCSKEPMRLIDISNQLNYNTSTTLRFFNSLERNGYVHKDRETLKYQMTYKLCGLASHISNRTGQMLRTTQRIGSQAPMHCTGVGKVILSEFPESKIDEMIRLKGLTRYTSNTLVTKEMLLNELQLIRKRGYGYDNEECEMGARCIAFPLHDYIGKIIAALSVTGPLGRMTDDFINSCFRTILETVQDISCQLGYHS